MMRFFEPTDQFYDWLAAYAAGRVVFDVGCGIGHVMLTLHTRNVKCIGIDPRYRCLEKLPIELMSCVLPEEAQDCRLIQTARNAVLLFCRPCHSGFVAETIRAMHPTSEAIYISKPENINVDLHGFQVVKLKSPKCPEEKVYRVLRGWENEGRIS